MINVEIKKRKRGETSRTHGSGKYVVINGVTDIEGFYLSWADKDSLWQIGSDEAYNIVANLSLAELREHFGRISTHLGYPKVENENTTHLYLEATVILEEHRVESQVAPRIEFQIMFDFEEWAHPWTPRQFSEIIIKEAQSNSSLKAQIGDEDDLLTEGIFIDYMFENDSDLTFDQTISNGLDVICSIIANAKQLMLSVINQDSLVTHFKFPKGTESVCSQYLMYFGQFLQDLGIEADAEIKQSVNETLFKVTPRSREESLIKIKEALAQYLTAPSSPSFADGMGSTSNDVAITQWQSNVLNFQSQMMLMRSTIQMQETTIEALKLNNYQLKQLVPQTSSEDVIPGVLSVEKYEGSWFSVNFPELLRRLKRKFK
jgi:hypothetical protein